MADELLAYARHVRALAAAGEGEALHQQIVDALAGVCDVLLAATDHNFKHYKTSTLVRRIGRRMQIHRLRTADQYVERLRADKDEVAALFKELLIGVTQFFRDPEAFDALARQVLPQVFADRPPTDPVRVWVPGCATGEEAYTLAMLVRERLDQVPHPPEVQIFATDINERSLAVARQGAYPAVHRRGRVAGPPQAVLPQEGEPVPRGQGGPGAVPVQRPRPDPRPAVQPARPDLAAGTCSSTSGRTCRRS